MRPNSGHRPHRLQLSRYAAGVGAKQRAHHNRCPARDRARMQRPIHSMSHVFADDDASLAPPSGRGDAYALRFVVTAMSYTLFGIGALVLTLLVLPVLRLLPQKRCQKLSRSLLSRAMRFFVAVMSGTKGMTYEIHGAEKLGQPGQLIVANHPTLLDAVFLIAFTPQAVCVAKHAMFRNPLTRSVVAAAGYVSNELTADMIEQAAVSGALPRK